MFLLAANVIACLSAGTASQDGPIGTRPCHLAFVIQLSQLLRQLQEGYVGDHQQLAGTLKVTCTKQALRLCSALTTVLHSALLPEILQAGTSAGTASENQHCLRFLQHAVS